MDSDAKFYRERAEQCRRLAATTLNEHLIEDLDKLAAEFDAEASKLEAAAMTHE